MLAIWIIAALVAAVVIGLVVWVLVQNTQDQKKNEQLESQMNELRRDLLGLSTSQAQSAATMQTIGDTVATRLESVTKALQEGIRDSTQTTSQITSQAQNAMSTELKNTREQISQVQTQLGELQQSSQHMQQATQTLEHILGGTKSRGSFGEVTLERLLEDCLHRSQYSTQFRFRSGEAADAVIHLRDKKFMAIDSKFPLDAYRRLATEGEDARKTFVAAVKGHAESIARKYIVPDENTLEVALMFVPSETVYYELLMSVDSKGEALDAYCRNCKILVVSPNNLFAYLSVIDMGLRGMRIEENARRLSASLDGMRIQLDKFSESFEKVGTHLKNAQQSYAEADKRFDKASNTLETMRTSGGPAQLPLDPLLESAQGSLELPPPVVAKKSA
jgi:DNA recombination protein RmuC